jgi:hypothetical protein
LDHVAPSSDLLACFLAEVEVDGTERVNAVVWWTRKETRIVERKNRRTFIVNWL